MGGTSKRFPIIGRGFGPVTMKRKDVNKTVVENDWKNEPGGYFLSLV